MVSAPLVTVIVLGGLLAALAFLLAARHIYKHLKYYSKPEYQRHIVRILAMVPIYSTTSWFALVLENEKVILILELVRDTYEAYVIYNFVVLLIAYSGGDLHICRYLEAQPRMPHPFPGKLWFPPIKLGPTFYNYIRWSVLQFVFVKPTTSVAKLWAFSRAGPGSQSLILIILTIINNASVSCALYGLVLFYHAAHELLLPYQPFEKFLSVKAVVFFSFWQGAALSIAVKLGLLQDVEGYTAYEQATGLQDFLICLEMAIAAIAHYFVFSYREYQIGNECDEEFSSDSRYPLLQVFDFRDVLKDAKDRFYGGVGFGTELRDGKPLVDNIDELLQGEPTGATQYVRSSRSPRPVSVSADLMTIPWRFREPQPLPPPPESIPPPN